MSSTLARRYRKQAAKWQVTDLESLLFGWKPAPSDEHSSERAELLRQFRALLADYKEGNAERLWKFLKAKWADYDAERDGMSRAMGLVDNVEALRDDEDDARASAPSVAGELGAELRDEAEGASDIAAD